MPMKTPAHIKIAVITLLLVAGALASWDDGRELVIPPQPWKCGATTVTLSNGILRISGKGAMGVYDLNRDYYEDRGIDTYPPWLYLYSREQIKSVVIEDGVTSIRSQAFMNCTNLTSVTIPNSVTSIGYEAFENCTGLKSVSIPNSVTSIEYAAFRNCHSLTSITIPNSVKTIGGDMFASCSSLTSINATADNENYSSENGVLFNKDKTILIMYPKGRQGAYTIPQSVIEIGGGAFMGCTGLTSVTIPDSVTIIKDVAFMSCIGLTSVIIPNSVTAIGNRAFLRCTGLTSITIPNSVTAIGEEAFYGCAGLKSITIPGGMRSVERETFRGCSSLTSITIPGSVTSIEKTAFSGCTGLMSINVSKDNSVYSSVGGIFFNKDKTILLRYPPEKPGPYTIPSSVTAIGESAFANSKSLTSVTIPNSVISIGENAFHGCTGLASVTIPGGVKTIGEEAFYKCTGLKSVAIPNSVISIGDNAFHGCTSLTSITIPGSVKSIGKWAFRYCKSLKSVTVPGSVASIEYGVFTGCAGLTSLTIEDGVTAIKPGAFSGCAGLTSVTIPRSVDTLGDGAFSGCKGLASVTSLNPVPPGIGWHVFESIHPNASLYVPAGSVDAYRAADHVMKFKRVMAIGDTSPPPKNTWRSGATTVTLSGTTIRVSGIGNMANYISGFSRSKFESLITDAVVEEGVTSIGEHAFMRLSGLKSVTIPNSVTDIGDGAFLGCTGLASITIPRGVKRIAIWSHDGGVFDGCTGLKSIEVAADNAHFSSVDGILFNKDKTELILYPKGKQKGAYAYTIPDGVKSIGYGAFESTGLTSITFPSSVYKIEREAFSGCRGLTSVTIGDGVRYIEKLAFWGCTGLKSVAVPGNMSRIDDDAFAYCTSLTSINVGKGGFTYSSVDGVLFDKAQKTLIHYPQGRKGAYTIPGSVREIAEYVFSHRTGLTSVTIPNGVDSIGNRTFAGCTALKSVTIPGSVKKIGWGAFRGCAALMSVTCLNPVPPAINDIAFDNLPSNACLYVPKGSIDAYRATEGWKDFKCIKDLESAPKRE